MIIQNNYMIRQNNDMIRQNKVNINPYICSFENGNKYIAIDTFNRKPISFNM